MARSKTDWNDGEAGDVGAAGNTVAGVLDVGWLSISAAMDTACEKLSESVGEAGEWLMGPCCGLIVITVLCGTVALT